MTPQTHDIGSPWIADMAYCGYLITRERPVSFFYNSSEVAAGIVFNGDFCYIASMERSEELSLGADIGYLKLKLQQEHGYSFEDQRFRE